MSASAASATERPWFSGPNIRAATHAPASFGWRDIVDLGDLSTARGTELLLPIWLSLMGALGLAPSSFQFKVVR